MRNDLPALSVHKIKCPSCLGDQFSHLAKVNEYVIVRCATCSLAMLNPQPTLESLNDYYDSVYYSTGSIDELTFEQIMQESVGKNSSFVNTLKQLKQMDAKKRLLDVGCAFGQFLTFADYYGFNTSGVEYNIPLAAKARTFGLDVIPGDFMMLDLPKGEYDVITLWYVLEHVPNPIQFLQKTYRLLSPGGILFVRVPNLSFGLPFLKINRLGYFRYPSIFSHIPAHLFFFDQKALQKIINQVGYKSLEFKSGDPVYSPPRNYGFRIANLFRKFYAVNAIFLRTLTAGRLDMVPYLSLFARKA